MKVVAAAVVAVVSLVLVPIASGERIAIVANTQHVVRIPFPPKGRGGDAEAVRWVVNDRYGRAIGDLLLDCRWVTAGLRLCVSQLSLPLGALALIGASRTRFLGQLAVVGGTGRYVGANGTMFFRQVSSGRYVLSIEYEVNNG